MREEQTLVDNNIAFSTDGGGTFTYAGEVINGVIVPPLSKAGQAPTLNDARFTVQLAPEFAEGYVERTRTVLVSHPKQRHSTPSGQLSLADNITVQPRG